MQSTVTSDISLSVVSAVLFLVSICSNLIIIIHTLKRKVFKDTCQSRIIILNTAIVDLFGSFDCLASALGYYSRTYFTEHAVICEMEAFRQGFFKSQAHNALLLLAMNRFYMLVKPGRANQEFSKFMATLYIICTWLYSLWVLIFVRLSDHRPVYSDRFGACMLEIDPITGLCLFTIRLLVIFGIVYCYARALHSFRKRQKALTANMVNGKSVKIQEPAERIKSVEPGKRAEPVERAEQVEPTEIAEPVERAERVELADTKEPMEQMELEPVDPVDPVDPVERAEQVEPAERAEPVERTEPVERADTTEPTEQVELMEPMDLRGSNTYASMQLSSARNRRKKTLRRVRFYPLLKLGLSTYLRWIIGI